MRALSRTAVPPAAVECVKHLASIPTRSLIDVLCAPHLRALLVADPQTLGLFVREVVVSLRGSRAAQPPAARVMHSPGENRSLPKSWVRP